MKFNPLAVLDDKYKYNLLGEQQTRLSKVINSGYIEKLKFSYYVFAGKSEKTETGAFIPANFGVLDYFGLLIPHLLFILLMKCAKWADNVPVLPYLLFIPNVIMSVAIVMLIGITNFLIKPLLAASLTLAVAAPILFLVQPITYAIKKYNLSKVSQLLENELKPQPSYTIEHTLTSDDYPDLRDSLLQFKNGSVNVRISSFNLKNGERRLQFWKNYPNDAILQNDYKDESLKNSPLAQNLRLIS